MHRPLTYHFHRGEVFLGFHLLLQLGHGVLLLPLLHVRHLQYHLQLRYLGQAPDLLHLPFLHQAPDLLNLPHLHEVRDPLQLPSQNPVDGQPRQGVYLYDIASLIPKLVPRQQVVEM